MATITCIRIPSGRSIPLGQYAAAWKKLLTLPPDTRVPKWDHFDTDAADVLREMRAGMMDRINRNVEINSKLCDQLRQNYPLIHVHNCDFLWWNPQATHIYDRVLMNPPFENASDIKHIKHALKFLRDGGRLVAICANGPRQERELQPLCTSWEELPAGTFAGTNVRTVLLTIDK